ncbi:NAD kinase [Jiulongibacter sediminis]|uniref:NAD kinase n=1 Tax=Jiulongibacter sediminis TaxID=1605367 RepID=A0A0P7C0A8_9BACT|nr:NAD kinase [Jiulongibacter sediminis]KPM50063.1 inorganic polyphosphate kinase [Jiulongibacter sediminis]TBX27088.1 inorganic polyphosphate kinase [Jiulongibacter sediminis]
MHISLHGREFRVEDKASVQAVFDELSTQDIDFQISDSFRKVLSEAEVNVYTDQVFETKEGLDKSEMVLSLGGDGTFLETVAKVGSTEKPILGVNFGRLGFLTSIQPSDIKPSVQKILNHQYKLDERTMVSAESETELFESGTNFALNEIAISKTDTSSMIIIHAYINGEFLNSYWADGLMVATATGSTGYSLSCGGPLVMPHSDNFIITPICPHNLFVRPMIVSNNSEISLKVESRSNNYLVSMDSRAKVIGDVDSEITIKKESFKARLVTLDGMDFLDTLREKLGWGKDVRNRLSQAEKGESS